jgi:hypothetical protein
LKVIFRFFIIIYYTIFLVYEGLASEGVYIFNEDNVVFHSDNYAIVNAVDKEFSTFHIIATDNNSFKKKNLYAIKKKCQKKLQIKLVDAPIQLKKETKKVKKTKDCFLVSKTTKNRFIAFNDIPIEERKHEESLDILRDIFIAIKKNVIKVFKVFFYSSSMPSFALIFLHCNVILLFYVIFIEEYKKVHYSKKRGPPYNL